MNKTIFSLLLLSLLSMGSRAQTVTDIDGNVYNTIAIGTQLWMKENLKVTHYNNGLPIPNITDDNTWSLLTTGARAYYNNDSLNFSATYGAIYNWYAVPNLCPANWHVPVDNDWIVLRMYLGGTNVAGGKMKSVTGWNFPNMGATNSSGFTGLPGGDRYDSGPFNYMGFFGHWWSSTANGGSLRWAMLLTYDTTLATTYYFNVNSGFAVRCICDIAASLPQLNPASKYFGLFPNPATDKIVIQSQDHKAIKIELYSLLGELLLQKEINTPDTETDISALPPGMYMLKAIGDGWTEQRKFIKE